MDTKQEVGKVLPVGNDPHTLTMPVTAKRVGGVKLADYLGTITASAPGGAKAEYNVSRTGPFTFLVAPDQMETHTDKNGVVHVLHQWQFDVRELAQAVAGKIHMQVEQRKEQQNGDG